MGSVDTGFLSAHSDNITLRSMDFSIDVVITGDAGMQYQRFKKEYMDHVQNR